MITTTLRIDEELYNKIKEESDEQERSINSQILYILKKHYEKLENNND